MKLHAVQITAIAVFALIFVAGGPDTQAQQAGPMVPPASTKVPVPPPTPKPEPPSIPPDEIIRRFAAKEDEMFKAIQGFSFQKSVRLEEVGPGNKVSGQLEIVTQLTISTDGKIYEKTVRRSPSTLHSMDLERGDSEILATTPMFPLTTSQLPKYEIGFLGKQPLDELSAYAFSVKPRALDRQHAYFSGVVWVDVDDLVIVKTIGKWVMETGDVTASSLPFAIFETYRQQVGKNFWFPSYASSDGSIDSTDGRVSMRIVVRWTDYTPAGNSAPATPTRDTSPAGKVTP